MFVKYFLTISCALALSLASGFSLAATAITTIPVTASVSKNCSLSLGSAIAFGAYDPTASAALNATGTIVLRCTKGTTCLSIGMNNGQHVSGSQRRLLGGTSADVLQYNVFQPPNNTPGTACTFPGVTAWTNTGSGLLSPSTPTSNAAQTYSVCGTIPGLQDVAVDSYTDTITATVNF